MIVVFCFSVSHKMIGILYLFLAIICGFVGFLYSSFIRFELSVIGCGVLFGDYHLYNLLITAHGIVMIFAFIMPVLLGGFTNFYVPIMAGFPDMIFPRLNNSSLWLYIAGVVIFVTGFSTEEGAGVGWTLYPSLICYDFHSSIGVDFVIFSVHLLGISSILNSLNVVGTVFVCRRKYFSVLNFLLFIWGVLFTSFLLVLTLPILAGGVTLVLLDRNFNTSFFDVAGGGDLVMFQHLFWFFGHPEVYIIILPVFGLISSLLEIAGARAVYSSLAMIYSIFAICLLGFFVWAHHMFVIGMDLDSRLYFGSITVLIGLPTCIKLFNWLYTICFFDFWQNFVIEYLICVIFIYMFIIGGVTGLLLANVGLDVLLHDTYFVVAHFHYVLSLGAVIGTFAGFFHFFVYLTLTESNIFFVIKFILIFSTGSNLVFFPLHYVGLLAFPRRISDYPVSFLVCNYNMVAGFFIIFSTILTFFGWGCIIFINFTQNLIYTNYIFNISNFYYFSNIIVKVSVVLYFLLLEFSHMLFELCFQLLVYKAIFQVFNLILIFN